MQGNCDVHETSIHQQETIAHYAKALVPAHVWGGSNGKNTVLFYNSSGFNAKQKMTKFAHAYLRDGCGNGVAHSNDPRIFKGNQHVVNSFTGMVTPHKFRICPLTKIKALSRRGFKVILQTNIAVLAVMNGLREAKETRTTG